MWIVLSVNNSRYQGWQVSDLFWSIELSISYVSLKSDNITCVEMSYVLARLSYLTICSTIFLKRISSSFLVKICFSNNSDNFKHLATQILLAQEDKILCSSSSFSGICSMSIVMDTNCIPTFWCWYLREYCCFSTYVCTVYCIREWIHL